MSDVGFIDKSGRRRVRKTHCIHGHKFDGTEVWATNWKGYSCRVCRECSRERQRRKRANPEQRRLNAERAKRYRQNNPAKYRESYQREHEKKRQLLLDARVRGCIKCGETHPSCLDFHHRNGKLDKLGHIGEIRRFSVERILAEIAKCDVLCANCHRKHHWNERQQVEGEG